MKNVNFEAIVNVCKAEVSKALGYFQGFRGVRTLSLPNIKSLDYKNELAAFGITFFAHLAINFFDLGGELDNLSMVIPFILFQVVFAAILTVILLYLFSSSYYIYTAKLLTTPVIWWSVGLSVWGVYDTFQWVDVINQELEYNFGMVLYCGNGQSQGLAELFSSDPDAKSGLAFFGGNADELVQMCKLIKNIKYVPLLVIFSELMAIGGFLICLRNFPIKNLKTKVVRENNED